MQRLCAGAPRWGSLGGVLRGLAAVRHRLPPAAARWCLDVPANAGCSTAATADAETQCVERDALGGAQYAACSSPAECKPGLFCVAGICNAYCAADADCGGERCVPLAPPRFSVGVNVGFCAAVCNPAAPSSSEGGFGTCPPGLGCQTGSESSGGSYCRQAGFKQRYELCELSSECAAGLFCASGVDYSYCRPYCLSDDDCSPGRCRLFDTGRAGDAAVGGCAEVCNPVAPGVSDETFSACPSGFGCALDSGGLSSCRRSGTGRYGSACEIDSNCAPGFYCGLTSGRCRQWCFDAGDCESGVCNLHDPPALAAGRRLGNCTDP